MRILKEYETKLNIAPRDMYNGSLNENNLLAHIKNKFENICMDASFVVAIRGVNRRSMVAMDKSDLGGGGTMHIQFCAEALVYTKDDVLVGCEVINIERDGLIMCRHEHALVHIKGNRNFAPSKGDLIIARVQVVGYPLGSNQMNIAAIPYTIPLKFGMDLTRPKNNFGEAELNLFYRKMAEYSDVRKRYDDLDQTLVTFFEEMFYPLKTPGMYYAASKNKITLKTSYESWDILQLVESALNGTMVFKSEYIVLSRHAAIPKWSPQILTLTVDQVRKIKETSDTMGDPNKFEKSVVTSEYSTILIKYMSDYIDHLDMICRCCEVYGNEEIRNKQSRLWHIYSQIKQ
jgi:hypothetical protein